MFRLRCMRILAVCFTCGGIRARPVASWRTPKPGSTHWGSHPWLPSQELELGYPSRKACLFVLFSLLYLCFKVFHLILVGCRIREHLPVLVYVRQTRVVGVHQTPWHESDCQGRALCILVQEHGVGGLGAVNAYVQSA